ncbi:MAG: class I mannose-6-phosphate isomerase [Verrucomicrobiaceae bacterium]|nr:class I mannose-6-phosphate isomerase [Verrucomicrobiaceae bacterium]
MNHPLTFTPLPQQRIWGGRQLETRFHRTLPDPSAPYGESWDLVDREEAQSVVASGPESLVGLSLHDLWTRHRQPLFGPSLASHPSPRFPLLMKILDAREDLSLQVHPPEHLATELHGEPKTEMWFIAHAEPGAKIYAGLHPGVTREAFLAALANGTAADLVHVLHPRTGDCLFIPSGRLHAIGAGLLIYEIQQNSDTTYRVFDWNRLGLDGKPRDLHVEQSLASIDFTDIAPTFQTPDPDGSLVSCPHFDVRLGSSTTTPVIGGSHPTESLTLAVTQGSLQIGTAPVLTTGTFALLPPASNTPHRLGPETTPDPQWLEIRLPPA